MILFKNVSKLYPNGQRALNNVNLHLERGEMAFLTGHSGAGKSTLLKLIARIDNCSQGQILVDGKDINQLKRNRIPALRRSIGMIFQNPELLPERTVYDNIALPLTITGHHQEDIAKRVRAALDKVDLLKKEKLLPVSLSAGEQQRVGIARAIVNRPPLLLADEPTGNLDPALSANIMHLFEQFNQVGVSVLIATHDLALIATLRHRVITLKEGHVIHG